MLKSFFLKFIGLLVLLISFNLPLALAQPVVQDASFQSRCMKASELDFPECADSPSECGSVEIKKEYKTPFNCLYLQEPIGGRPGYDLFKVTPIGENVNYTLWYGEALVGNEEGPFQAILTYEEGKETQGPFGLLYNYLGLVYNFLSGIIIAFVVLVIILGGIRISMAGGNAEGAKAGREMIIKALVGMVIWFTASVILYTINPTFFAF